MFKNEWRGVCVGVWILYILLMLAHETADKNRKAITVGRREEGGAAVGMRFKNDLYTGNCKFSCKKCRSKSVMAVILNDNIITFTCQHHCKLQQYSHLHTVS